MNSRLQWRAVAAGLAILVLVGIVSAVVLVRSADSSGRRTEHTAAPRSSSVRPAPSSSVPPVTSTIMPPAAISPVPLPKPPVSRPPAVTLANILAGRVTNINPDGLTHYKYFPLPVPNPIGSNLIDDDATPTRDSRLEQHIIREWKNASDVVARNLGVFLNPYSDDVDAERVRAQINNDLFLTRQRPAQAIAESIRDGWALDLRFTCVIDAPDPNVDAPRVNIVYSYHGIPVYTLTGTYQSAVGGFDITYQGYVRKGLGGDGGSGG